MTNFTVTFYDANCDTIGIAHTTYFADAIKLAETLPNCAVTDFNTGEVLRIYSVGNVTYAV